MDLLVRLSSEIVVPRSVVEEIEAGPIGDPARQALSEGMFPIVTAMDLSEILAWDLGKGETAVLSHCLATPGAIAIIDDRAARKCAKSFAIPHKGTLSVIILARKNGLIPSAAEALRSLQAAGLRLDDAVIRDALRQSVGEDL